MTKKFLSMLLIFTLLASLTVPALGADTFIKRGNAAETIRKVAERYNPDINPGNLLVGNGDGNLRPEDPLTNAEAVVLLERAFGTIPEPLGNNKRLADPDASLENVPGWADSAYKALLTGGILSGKPEANAALPEEELEFMLQRLMRLYGNNPRDDFYQYVNKDWLETSSFPVGHATIDAFGEINETLVAQLEAILEELNRGSYQSGTPESYVSEFYKNAMNREKRNADGLAPLKKYLDDINSINDMGDLVRVHDELLDKLGVSILYQFDFSADTRNSTQKALFFYGPENHLAKDDLDSNNTDRIGAFKDSSVRLLTLSGDPEPEAQMEKLIEFEKQLSLSMLKPNELMDVDLAYEESTLEALDEMFGTVDLTSVAKAAGIKAAAESADTRVLISQYKLVEKFSRLLTDENIDVLKTYLKIDLLWRFGTELSDEFIDVFDDYNRIANGAEEKIPYKRRAIDLTLDLMGQYVGQIYIDKHFSEETKRDVEQMVIEFIGVYKESLSQNTWLSDETKAMALKKLDKLNYKIGYPDTWGDPLKGVDVGDSLFDNICALQKANHAHMIDTQDSPPDRGEWLMSVYTVNAYYYPPYNEIVFPAAILQAPFYNPDAKHEANLGGIGVVIAHEISHAFDNDGAKYNENGDAVNWWTESDYAEFEKRCQAAIDFYDGLEVGAGIKSDGALTLSENIADFEGLLCALTVAKKNPDADLKAFFEQFATIWRTSRAREMLQYYNVTNTHANPRIRTNRSLQNVADFYEVYGITEDDAMFVPAEQRVKIW